MVKFRDGQGIGNAGRILALALCLMVLVEHTSAARVQVGGVGWLLGVQYPNWMKGVKVRARDTLVFKYPAGQHNVLQVNKADYLSCNFKKPMKYLSSGNDLYTVSKPGTYYFVCGVGDHCKQGMKVAIAVSS